MQDNQIKGESEVVHCYAIRRVNPFRGVMQVIKAEEGRALSCNGIVWEILVRATQGSSPGSLGDDNNNRGQTTVFS